MSLIYKVGNNKWSVMGLFMLGLGWMSLFLSFYVSPFCLDYYMLLCDVAPLNLSLLIDSASLLFFGTVLIISGSVFVYCKWYMDEEIFYSRFMSLVVLFVGSMVSLVFISNLMGLLLGWDGLGITSFALVVFYQNNKSLGAGMLTALTNRIGDVFLLMSIGLMFKEGSWVLYDYKSLTNLSVCGALLMVAATTKSAQMPFSSWLPAAMAAPTPVSSLVHSSTLVTAGVYLVYRCYFIIAESFPEMLDALKIMSLMTLVMAGSSAIVEMDLKKIIALSTLSQLSMMMFSISICMPHISFFHLISHATFKALLFLCAGVVIHSNFGFQDMRVVSQSWRKMPVSVSCLMVANLSLCGCPFLSGFYSKDLVIELSFYAGDLSVFYILLVLGTLFTFLYSVRMSLFVLFSEGSKISRLSFLKESSVVKTSYASLLVSAIAGGFIMSEGYENFSESMVVSEFESVLILSLFLVAFLFYGSYLNMEKSSAMWTGVGKLFSSMWGMKPFFSHIIPGTGLMFSDYIVKSVEKGWLEKIGPMGAYEKILFLVSFNQGLQSYPFLKASYVAFLMVIVVLAVVSLSFLCL